MPSSILSLLITALLAPPAPATAATVTIREWPVPWEDTRPRDPAVDSRGQVWFVGQRGNYLASLDPSSGTFERIDLEPDALPHNLVVGRKGEIWYAGNGNGTIGRLDPHTGKITTYKMPDPAAKDPHTLVLDGSGNLWFTVQAGGFVGRLKTASGKIDLVKIPGRGTRPYGIVIDADGRPWFNEFGTNRIGTLDPKTLELKELDLPEGTRSRRIAIGSDGAVWYVDYALGHLGRLDPSSGEVRQWPTPGGRGSLPYAMAVDDRGRLWLVETGPQPNRLVGFDPRSESFFTTAEIPSGGSTVRHMIFEPKTRALWFGTDKGTIGRASIP